MWALRVHSLKNKCRFSVDHDGESDLSRDGTTSLHENFLDLAVLRKLTTGKEVHSRPQ